MARAKTWEDRWHDLGFHYTEVIEDYIRISDHEMDEVGAIVILTDAYGALKGYQICENENGDLIEIAIEFNEEMSRALYLTWKWIQVRWIT